MKKALVVLLALVLAGSLVFAQEASGITFGSWGRAIWGVASGTNDEVVTDVHQSWGGAAPRTSLNVRGDSDNVSYALDIFGNGSAISVGDNAYIEVRPGDWAALTIGKMDKNETRGDACFGMWDWDRIGVVGAYSQEGFIFGDLSDADRFGLSGRLYPIEGLTVGAAIKLNEGNLDGEKMDAEDILDMPLTQFLDKYKVSDYLDGLIGGNQIDLSKFDTSNSPSLADTYIQGNYFVMYDIANIGKLKVGYDGQGNQDDAWGVINAAFDVIAVDNLYFAIGGFIPTKGTKDGGQDIQVNAHVRYNMDPFAFHLQFGSNINSADKAERKADGAFGFVVAGGIDWTVLDNVLLNLDVRYANGIYMADSSDDNTDCFTAGVGIAKNWSNGLLGIGFECATNGYGRYSQDPDGFVWTIPVKFQYSF